MLNLLPTAILLGLVQLGRPEFQPTILASHQMSLEDRYAVPSVNQVFKDNILLTLNYLDGKVTNNQFDWNEVEKPFKYEFTLQPGASFAFHNTVFEQYKDKVTKTTHAHFNSDEGFKSDGFLMGDGVCHLASLMEWAAEDAGLQVVAPTNHNFATIPEVPREHGVAIYNTPNDLTGSAMQNLYITNNKDYPVTFNFDYDGKELKISVTK